jgi:hypothetical protein
VPARAQIELSATRAATTCRLLTALSLAGVAERRSLERRLLRVPDWLRRSQWPPPVKPSAHDGNGPGATAARAVAAAAVAAATGRSLASATATTASLMPSPSPHAGPVFTAEDVAARAALHERFALPAWKKLVSGVYTQQAAAGAGMLRENVFRAVREVYDSAGAAVVAAMPYPSDERATEALLFLITEHSLRERDVDYGLASEEWEGVIKEIFDSSLALRCALVPRGIVSA